jgi:hypothetical protein
LNWRDGHARYKSKNPIDWSNTKAKAKVKEKRLGVPFNISPRKMYELEQIALTGVCQATGIRFVLSKPGNGRHPFYPSIDCIDPNKQYQDDNVWVVIDAFNRIKSNLSLAALEHPIEHLRANSETIFKTLLRTMRERQPQ